MRGKSRVVDPRNSAEKRRYFIEKVWNIKGLRETPKPFLRHKHVYGFVGFRDRRHLGRKQIQGIIDK